MTFPTSSAFVAGNILTAAQLNAVRADLNSVNGFVMKTADESRTSTAVLANDLHLFYTVPAAGTYVFDAYLLALSAANAAGDLQVSFTFPTGTCHWGGHALDIALPSATIASLDGGGFPSASSGVSTHGAGLSTTATMHSFRGVLIATAAGTLRLQWAQFASNASASTLKTGSHMTIAQVA